MLNFNTIRAHTLMIFYLSINFKYLNALLSFKEETEEKIKKNEKNLKLIIYSLHIIDSLHLHLKKELLLLNKKYVVFELNTHLLLKKFFNFFI